MTQSAGQQTSGRLPSNVGMIEATFTRLHESGRKALIPYVTGGHPDPTRSIELLRGLEEAGADVIEVGVPFSDPMADGPAIQASSQQALANGMTFGRVLDLVAEAGLSIPVVLFTYLNPLIAAGSGLAGSYRCVIARRPAFDDWMDGAGWTKGLVVVAV